MDLAAADEAVLSLDTTFGHLIRRAQQVHTGLWKAEFADELTGPQYAVLSVLTRFPSADQATIGAVAALDRSNAADVVSRLGRNGWLDRDRDDTDTRRNVVRLTPAARAALRNITPRAERVQAELLAPLRPGDEHHFIRTLAVVAFAGNPPEAGPLTDDEAADVPALPLATTPGHLIRRSEQLHRQRWLLHVGVPLTPTQYELLAAVARRPDTDQAQIGELASLDKSSTAAIVSRLAARALLSVRRDERDRRRKLLTLTDAAWSTLARVTPSVELVQRDLTAPLTDQRARRLVELLRAVASR